MKTYLLAGLLLAATACTTETATRRTATCPELSDPQTVMAGQQARRYYTLPGFNPQSRECWALLRAEALEAGKSTTAPTVIAFIDAPGFTPGPDGLYGGDESMQQRVIAQATVDNDAGTYTFTPDPYKGGHYVEPQ